MTVGAAWQGFAPTMYFGADIGAAEMPRPAILVSSGCT
jgi:hypothetical protein